MGGIRMPYIKAADAMVPILWTTEAFDAVKLYAIVHVSAGGKHS
jgi:hypothetical protein